MTYYFLFSDGSYSDYAVGGLYKTEHHVPEDAWYKFVEQRQAERLDKLQEFKKKACKRVGIEYDEVIGTMSIYSTPEYKEYTDWRREQQSDDVVFQKLHNMVEVEYNECHGGM